MRHIMIRLSSFISLLAMLCLTACNNPSTTTVATPPEDTLPSAATDTVSAVPLPPQSEHVHTITISKMKFNPESLTIPKGDTILWINNDMTNHCVTEVNKAWTSSTLAPGQSWKKAITGNTDYFCAIHVVMKGSITVQ